MSRPKDNTEQSRFTFLSRYGCVKHKGSQKAQDGAEYAVRSMQRNVQGRTT
jgi:hypothetical protein